MESRSSRSAARAGGRLAIAALCLLLASPVPEAWAQRADPSAGSVSGSTAGSKLPFRGSTLIFDQSTTPETLGPSAQLSHLPSYQWWLSLRPRWYLTNTISLRLRLDLTTDWLNAAETTKKREPLWGDVWTEVAWSGIPELAGIHTTLSLRAIWPSSKLSQMRGYYTQLGLSLALSREFKSRIGTFGLDLVMVGTAPIGKATSGGFLADDITYDCVYGEFRGSKCDQMGGGMNPYFNLTAAVSARYAPPIGASDPLSLNLSYVVVDSFLYQPPAATLSDATGGTTDVARSAGDQRMRQAGWFSASIDYDATSWLSLGLGYYVFRPIRNPDSSIGNPFWSPGGNSRLFFSMTFSLDQVYQSIADRVKKSSPATPVASAP